MLDWLVVGGGLHGTYLSLVLAERLRVDRSRLKVLDPHESAFAMWRHCTERVGMQYLRSPSVHHLGLEPWSLQRFAKSNPEPSQWHEPYSRPALSLFNKHCEYILESNRLAQLRVKGRAQGLSPHTSGRGWRVETDAGTLDAKHLILALGVGEQPHWPVWADALKKQNAPISHVFENDPPNIQKEMRLVVVGGGISAAQIALKYAKLGHAVCIVSRHVWRVYMFDSDPGWIGPKYMRDFLAERSMHKRRQLITEARHRGSMPPDVRYALDRAQSEGQISVHKAAIQDASFNQTNITLTFAGGSTLNADHVLLATGFSQHRPGDTWLTQAITSCNLPCAPCGYPVLNEGLRWRDGLFVAGALAELELGPTARNMIGARSAGQRISGATA